MRHVVLRRTRPVFWLLLRLLPPRRYAVVHGWPAFEGNVVELLPGLQQRYPHPVFWLVDGDTLQAERHTREHGLTRVRVVPKTSTRAVRLAVTAETTFYTHGLFTAVDPPRNRLVVNVWHGDGPKTTHNAGYVRSSVVVTGARMWHRYKAETFAVPEQHVAWTGNPRSIALQRQLTEEQRSHLGLDPAATLVLWLPTYRIGHSDEGRLVHDGAPLSACADLRGLREMVLRPGLQLVVKPHPMDHDDYSLLGITVLTDADLRGAGVALYQLLGASAALLSDTSSVWVDYVALDRPIAFLLPDADELAEHRGFNVPDLPSILPGPVLRDTSDIAAWLERVLEDPSEPALLYPAERERIGAAPLGDPVTRLLDWLDDHQRRRGRRPLFAPRPETGTSRLAPEESDRQHQDP